MLPAALIISIISIVLILCIIAYIYYRHSVLSYDIESKFKHIIDKINSSTYYQYNYDLKQEENIENNDKNISLVYDSLNNLQNNVKILEKTKNTTDILNTNNANIQKLHLSNKWALTDLKDSANNDNWLGFLNKNNSGYYGGIASAKSWVRDNICIGNTCINEVQLGKLLTGANIRDTSVINTGNCGGPNVANTGKIVPSVPVSNGQWSSCMNMCGLPSAN